MQSLRHQLHFTNILNLLKIITRISKYIYIGILIMLNKCFSVLISRIKTAECETYGKHFMHSCPLRTLHQMISTLRRLRIVAEMRKAFDLYVMNIMIRDWCKYIIDTNEWKGSKKTWKGNFLFLWQFSNLCWKYRLVNSQSTKKWFLMASIWGKNHMLCHFH